MYEEEKGLDIEKTLKENRGKKTDEYQEFYKVVRTKKVVPKKVRVPILKPENFGERMCLDDKNLGDMGFSILSNLETGKIAMMIETRKAKIIDEVLTKHVPRKILNGVRILTKDLAYNYEEVRRNNFWYATGVADKFHVIKLGNQAISDLRVKYRQEELTKERERRESHKCSEAEKREQAEQQGKTYKIKKCSPPERMENGETILQILASTNRALSQFPSKWGKEMKKRVKILFKKFPDIEKIYKLISVFRGIYNTTKKGIQFGESLFQKSKQSLQKWYQSVGALEISELQNFASTVKHHENEILAYFKTGDSNAYAESLNAKLQRFLRQNFGIKNKHFFLWRINKIFS